MHVLSGPARTAPEGAEDAAPKKEEAPSGPQDDGRTQGGSEPAQTPPTAPPATDSVPQGSTSPAQPDTGGAGELPEAHEDDVGTLEETR